MKASIVNLICAVLLLVVSTTEAKVYNCSTSQQLRNAAKKVLPGDNIFLADGVYNSTDGGIFRLTRSGNATHPIVMNSTGGAVLVSGDRGYALWLQNASYWNIRSK